MVLKANELQPFHLTHLTTFHITAIPNGNGKADLSKARIGGDSMSGKQLWLGRFSSLKFEKSCGKAQTGVAENTFAITDDAVVLPDLSGKRPPISYSFLQVTLF